MDYINNIEKKPNTKKDVLASFLVIIAVFLIVFLFVTVREHGARNILETITVSEEKEEKEEQEVEQEWVTEKEKLEDSNDKEVEKEKEIEAELEEKEIKEKEELDRTKENETKTDRTQETKGKMSYYRITAGKGEGLTHISRTALNKYLSDKNINLSPEQKVYAEDYAQKRLQEERSNSDLVLLNEEVWVSYEYIEDGVDSAQSLTNYQINNLTQFVPLN